MSRSQKLSASEDLSSSSATAAETPVTPASVKTAAKRGGVRRVGKAGPRKNKYNAAGERIDGMWFASAAEGKRYLQLKSMMERNMIDNLRCQVKLPCVVNNRLICTYIADFAYVVIDDRGVGIRSIWEDVKGMITDVYKIKKKLVQAVHNIEILEIPGGSIAQWADKTG
jgi:hypothetical protein